MKTAILIVQLLTWHGAAVGCQMASGGDPGFLGLHLGMKASAAMRHEGKDPDAFRRINAHSGERVFSDTLLLTSCKMAMRRSLGFDSVERLTAIGLTYKTTPGRIQEARDCAYRWLSKRYGPATAETIRDSTKQEVWKLGPAQITLEAKGYNPTDYFVLIYYYKEISPAKQP